MEVFEALNYIEERAYAASAINYGASYGLAGGLSREQNRRAKYVLRDLHNFASK